MRICLKPIPFSISWWFSGPLELTKGMWMASQSLNVAFQCWLTNGLGGPYPRLVFRGWIFWFLVFRHLHYPLASIWHPVIGWYYFHTPKPANFAFSSCPSHFHHRWSRDQMNRSSLVASGHLPMIAQIITYKSTRHNIVPSRLQIRIATLPLQSTVDHFLWQYRLCKHRPCHPTRLALEVRCPTMTEYESP